MGTKTDLNATPEKKAKSHSETFNYRHRKDIAWIKIKKKKSKIFQEKWDN